jgi:hypothetical protein
MSLHHPYALLIYPIIPGLIIGTLNWYYWKRKGYSSYTNLIMSWITFYAVSYLLLKLLR